MANILLITTGLTGVLYAGFEVMSRLENAGHHLTYACPHECRAEVEAQGFAYEQLPKVLLRAIDRTPNFSQRWRRILYRFTHIKQHREEALADLKIDKFTATLQRLQPDLILIDVELHEYIISSISLDYQVVLLSQWFTMWEAEGVPPLQSDLIPNENNKTAIRRLWQQNRRERRSMIWRQKIRSFFTDRGSVLTMYARQVGFPMQELLPYQWPAPFAYRTLPVLSMTAWELEFPHTPRPNLHYIGPMVYAERKDTRTKQYTKERLQQIFEEKKENGHALIYCSFTTMRASDNTFAQKIIEAVTVHPDWILIMGHGGISEGDILSDMPKNIHIFDWIPQLYALQHADCSINHGGIHTINECIHFRVPMLVYSGQKSDQDACAARIAYHQVGIMADKNKDNVSTIRRNIETVLSNEIFTKNLATIHEKYHTLKQNKTLECLIKNFIQSKQK